MLVPTRVGMILNQRLAEVAAYTCPHTRGDDPIMVDVLCVAFALSPHAWG